MIIKNAPVRVSGSRWVFQLELSPFDCIALVFCVKVLSYFSFKHFIVYFSFFILAVTPASAAFTVFLLICWDIKVKKLTCWKFVNIKHLSLFASNPFPVSPPYWLSNSSCTVYQWGPNLRLIDTVKKLHTVLIHR